MNLGCPLLCCINFDRDDPAPQFISVAISPLCFVFAAVIFHGDQFRPR
jgi:hypothetical protein